MNYSQVQVSASVLDLVQKMFAVAAAAQSGGASEALAVAISDLVPAVADVQAIPADLAADKGAVIKAALDGVIDGLVGLKVI